MFTRTIALTLTLLACVASARAQAPAPKASAEDLSWDAGRVESGTPLEHKFALRNTGAAPLRIENVQLSGKELKARIPQSIAPGETGEVTAQIDTQSVAGSWKWGITLQTNDETMPVVAYNIEAYVYAPLEVDPLELYFSLYDNETAAKSVTITNHQTAPLAIKGVEKKDGSHFTAALSTQEAGRKYQLQVTVPKSVEPGRYLEAVRLQTDDPKHPTVQVGVNVFVKRDVYVFPDSASFGQVAMQQAKNPDTSGPLTQTLLVTKRAGDFAITGVETNIPFLSIQKTPSARAGTFRLDIGLSAEGLKPGEFHGEIQIKTDAPGFPKLIVPVTGEIM
ncbi:MAG TPA: DUF1573 domain-containing protein [Rudaea sp.]|nr:DUF1573 domain-containing protein [Rudaea sp.]